MRSPFSFNLVLLAVLTASATMGAFGAASSQDRLDHAAAMIAAAHPPPATQTAAKPALPPCLQPQGDPIPAQKIMNDLVAGRTVDLQGRIIDGSLDADVFGVASDEHRMSLRI